MKMENTNYQVLQRDNGLPVKAWINDVPFEDEARRQLHNVASLPFVYKWIAAMPDVHAGKGATIGSVIATDGAIIPAAVGVDIGCGMMAVKTDLVADDLPEGQSEGLARLRGAIERNIPHGRTHDGRKRDRGAWQNIPSDVEEAWGELAEDYEKMVEKHPQIRKANSKNHLGTLGTGNHFIEICLDADDSVWIMLHSGSRGIGNRIGTYFIKEAQKLMKQYFIELPDRDLAYLAEGTDIFWDYIKSVQWAQKFAKLNRKIMMNRALQALSEQIGKEIKLEIEEIDCHHNYVAKEQHFGKGVWVTRKGAVRAREGDMGIIPGSMGVRSYIVRGLGNAESFCSCSHGAGRVMSRTKAKKTISIEEHIEATKHVECRKDTNVLDETPAAYKDIDAVMEAQKDLVEIVYQLKQLICIKG